MENVYITRGEWGKRKSPEEIDELLKEESRRSRLSRVLGVPMSSFARRIFEKYSGPVKLSFNPSFPAGESERIWLREMENQVNEQFRLIWDPTKTHTVQPIYGKSPAQVFFEDIANTLASEKIQREEKPYEVRKRDDGAADAARFAMELRDDIFFGNI